MVEAALKQTLEDLGVEYLDLYLMHWPVSADPKTGETELEFVQVCYPQLFPLPTIIPHQLTHPDMEVPNRTSQRKSPPRRDLQFLPLTNKDDNQRDSRQTIRAPIRTPPLSATIRVHRSARSPRNRNYSLFTPRKLQPDLQEQGFPTSTSQE